jgi:hypothetical protein
MVRRTGFRCVVLALLIALTGLPAQAAEKRPVPLAEKVSRLAESLWTALLERIVPFGTTSKLGTDIDPNEVKLGPIIDPNGANATPCPGVLSIR